MSRSNPNQHVSNPATRWMEWNGEQGLVRYYDKEAKKNIDVRSDFTFLLLDQLGCVNGWSDASDSAIYSNEVRDTRQEVFVVKSFKGGTIAEGLYSQIRDQVKAAGGSYHANCYVAYKKDGELQIGSIKFKGAALHAWAEFTKANRNDLDSKAVRIDGYTEGKKGRIVYRMPIFKIVPVSDDTNLVAVGLDMELQTFLTSYLKRTKGDQVESNSGHVSDEDMAQEAVDPDYVPPVSVDDSDVPF